MKSSNTSSLGTRAKAGIGIAGAGGAISLAGLGFFIYRQRKSTKELRDQVRLLGVQENGEDKHARVELELAAIFVQGPPPNELSPGPDHGMFKDNKPPEAPPERFELGQENRSMYAELLDESR